MTTLDIAAAPRVPEKRKVAVAGQWQLMWWRFRRHRLAVWSLWIVVGLYVIAAFSSFIAPRSTEYFDAGYTYAPPQMLRFFERDAAGNRHVLAVHSFTVKIDPIALQRNFTIDPAKVIPVTFFARGERYKFWGLFETNLRLIGPVDPKQPFYLWGADRLGRDVFSRTIHGTGVSMSIGLIGVAISLVLGILLGGLSGLNGGWVDELIQRTIDFLKSIPTIPLWMGLAAAIPINTDPLVVYFWITVILSLIGWTDVARVVRGRFLALRTEDFVIAARLDGCRKGRVIFRHMVPSFMSHIIASVTLAIPTMILAETALSFLGIGLKPPVVSWGVLLKEAQNILAVAEAPWLFAPGVAVVIAVLAFNFLGDGLRDAADPYS
jgi:peptide/nickel transport system permease protein